MIESRFVSLHEIDPDAATRLPDELEWLVSNLTIEQIVAREFDFGADAPDQPAASAAQMSEAADLADLEFQDPF